MIIRDSRHKLSGGNGSIVPSFRRESETRYTGASSKLAIRIALRIVTSENHDGVIRRSVGTRVN